MPERRCSCCDLPVSMCGKAAEQAAADAHRARVARALAEPGVTPAKFPGRCPTCRSGIAVGDPVYRTEDGWTGYLCCPREEA